MKRIILSTILAVFFFSGIASAQIMVPPAAGGVAIRYTLSYTGAPVYTSTAAWSTLNGYIQNGLTFYTYTTGGVTYYSTLRANYQTIVEFDLSPVAFPASYTAALTGITLTTSAGSQSDIELYDLAESSEDGAITAADFNNIAGAPIATYPGPQTGAVINVNEDVTAEVVTDQANMPGNNYSGFLFRATFDPVCGECHYVDLTNAQLVITQQAVAVPALNNWGIVLLALGVAVIAVLNLRKRRAVN